MFDLLLSPEVPEPFFSSRPAFRVSSILQLLSQGGWSQPSLDLSVFCKGNKHDTGSVDTVTDLSSSHNHGLMCSALPVPEALTTFVLVFSS